MNRTGNDDPEVQKLISSRNSSAVIKAQFAKMRSEHHNITIFAMEGAEDKVVYFHWIKALRPNLAYEPFPCGGKGKVLQLRETMKRDKTGLNTNVFYLLDRDFDDLRDHDYDSNTFVTLKYSVENYLVTELILEQILRDEMHCDGHIDARKKIVNHFLALYDSFLEELKEVNFRIFLARKLRIEILGGLNFKLKDLVVLDFKNVRRVGAAEDIVRLGREPTANEIAEFREEFENLYPRDRYRGKFSLLFFLKWLSFAVDERKNCTDNLFRDMQPVKKVLTEQFQIYLLAAKSHPPNEFVQFLDREVA